MPTQRPRSVRRAAAAVTLLLTLGASPACAAAPAGPPDVLVLETTKGEIAIQLFPKDAPRTVENLRKLTAAGFYDGLTFHRVRPGFVLQGGDPNSRNENPFDDGRGGPPYLLPAEIGRKHVRGSVAMAREPDAVNPERRSNASQFYIALRDLPHLDGAYTVFGEVLSGWATIDSLVALANVEGIARVGDDFNPGTLAQIRLARLETLAAWRARQRKSPAKSGAKPDTSGAKPR
jgi:peptidyl-prolyl cis-trans isomerase B (cyclophilin B)